MSNSMELHRDLVSFTQESIWLVDRLSVQQGEPAYHEPLAFHLTGPVDVAALGLALRDVVARHEALRTSIVEAPEGLRAVVRPAPRDLLRVVDLRDVAPARANERGLAAFDATYHQPFDLAVDPLLRAVLVLLPGDESLLGLTVHHIATDDWSNRLIVESLQASYAARRDGRTPPDVDDKPMPRFLDRVRGERQRYAEGGFAESIDAWRRSLDRRSDLLRMPLDRPRPAAQTFAGSSRTIQAPQSTVRKMLDLCRRECRTTDFTALLAAYAVLLNRYTGQGSVTVATTALNRGDADLLDVVGCFVNTAALVIDLDDDPTFRKLLGRVSELSQQVLVHGDAPYSKVVEALDVRRDPSHNPVFQTMLTMLTRRPVPDFGAGITARRLRVQRGAAKFEILLYVSETEDAFEFEMEFNSDLYTAETVERLLRHFVTLLDRLTQDIDAKVSTVSFLPDEEQRLITQVWNNTATDYPDSTVIDLFEAQARATPDAVAVEFEGRSLTYGQLNRLTNQIARAIIARSANASPFIGVYLERSLEMVVALVSIVKAGLAYVPIDPEYPADRVLFMIEDSGVTTVLTQQHRRDDLDGTGVADVMVLSVDDQRDEDHTDVVRRLSPDSPVYMIYTSGSTGRPKGAINRHVSLFNRLRWMQDTFRLTGADRVLQKTPFSFDVSVWEFFWPLMVGATIVVARPGGHRDADYMKRLIAERGVTTVHFIPSILNVFLEEDELPAFCGSLRRVVCSGEALTHKAVRKFLATLPWCELHNLYGPTEAAIDVSHWPCTVDYPGAVVPIGKPIANTQLFVVDRNLALQPVGVPGELCIGGVQLATGYHRRPELTRTVFVSNPHGPGRLYRTGDLARFLPDGQIQYLGRIDNQIKLRGVRIEPEEVSAALLELPGIKDAAVVLHEAGTSRMLVGYVVADAFDQARIKDALRSRLPEFMLPQIVMPVPKLPSTPNGKLDRRALPDPLTDVDGDEAVVPPRNPDEKIFVQVWSEVLGTDQFGVDTNFFRHGGDSILSITVAAQLRAYGYPVEVQDIFQYPTVRTLVAAVAGKDPVAPLDAVAPLALVADADRRRLPATVPDAWPLTRLQSGMIYHTMLAEHSSVYHDIFDYDIDAVVRPDLIASAVRLVTRAHPVLRSTIDLDSYHTPMQLVHDAYEVPVQFTDLTGLTGPEQDAAIVTWIEREKRHRFDLATGPLVRLHVHRRSDRQFNLALSFHHALLDGWSVARVMEDFRRAYADLLAGRAPRLAEERISYSTFVALERQIGENPAAAEFWSELLRDTEATQLLTVDGRAEHVPASAERLLSAARAEAAQAFAGTLGVPAKSVFLAVHLTVLGRLTGRNTIVSGLVSSGRPEISGGADLAGLYLNTLPFPIELRREPWQVLVERVFATEQRCVPYRRYPLADIVRRTGEKPPFNTIFNYTDFHVYADTADDGVRIAGSRYFEQTNFDAVVHLHRDHFRGTTSVVVNHDASRIGPELVERYLDEFVAAVEDVTAGGLASGPESVRPRPGHSRTDARGVDSVQAVRIAPRSELERQVNDVIIEATGATELGIDDDYLDRGVDSITAIRVVARLRRSHPSVGLADVFADRTVRRLAERIASAPSASGTDHRTNGPFALAGVDRSALPADVVDAYPATQLQLAMIDATGVDPAQARYHDVFGYRLALPLDPDVLRSVLERLTEAHETFRSSFLLHAHPIPLRLVHPAARVDLRTVDLPSAGPQAAFDAWFEAEKATTFDWSAGAPIRWFAHRWPAGDFTLTVSFHHSMIDGWSLSLVIREIVRRYAERLAGVPVATPPAARSTYRDFVAAELAARESSATRAFWRNVVSGAPALTLTDRTGVADRRRWSETKVVLSAARQQAINRLAADARLPVKSVFLAVHLQVLGLLTGVTDLTTGVFTNGRLEEDGGDETVGLFLNFVPLRHGLDGGSWRELARQLFDQERRTMPHRRFPLPDIERMAGRSDLFPAIFNYTRFSAYREIAGSGQRIITDLRWFEHTPFPLLVNVGHELNQQRVIITLNADGRRLSQHWIEAVGALYDATLAQLAEGADTFQTTPAVTEALRRLNIDPAKATGTPAPERTTTMTTASGTNIRIFEQSDGYRTHYRQWGPDEGRDVIVLLHGGMSHSGWQAPLGEALADTARLTFVAVDRRGSGLNDGRGHIPSSEQVLTDTTELLRHLADRFGRVHLAGWCFGGQVATAVAGRAAGTDLIDSLLLVAPGFFFNKRYSDVLRLSIESAEAAVEEFQLRPEPTRAYIKVPLEAADFTTRPEWRDFIERDALKLTKVTDGTVTAWDELSDLAGKAFANLGDLPVLAVFGRQDRLVDNARVQEFLRDGKRVTIEELDTGHAVHFEEVDALAGMITSFIAQG